MNEHDEKRLLGILIDWNISIRRLMHGEGKKTVWCVLLLICIIIFRNQRRLNDLQREMNSFFFETHAHVLDRVRLDSRVWIQWNGMRKRFERSAAIQQGEQDEKKMQRCFKCDQAQGVLAWLICQSLCTSLIIRATQFRGAFKQENQKEHTHTCQSTRIQTLDNQT